MKTGWAVAALVALLAISACGQDAGTTAVEVVEVQATDAEPKFIGAVGPDEFAEGGDAILTTVRDVQFILLEDATVEAFVTPVDSDMRVQMLNGSGDLVAEMEAPAGHEVRLEGPATGGEPYNTIRVTRPEATGNVAAFSFRARAL